MSAKDYAITQGYGYDPTYPTADHFHKGIDYGCPMQTPVIVNDIQIGLSGNSGFVTGPHLHVGRWLGGQYTNPGVGNGFNFGEAVVTEINEDATNGKYVRLQADGASWVYLHLFEQTCEVGQRLTPAVPTAPAPASPGSHVILPASVQSWAAYHVGSGLRKGTSDQVGTLLPAKFGGLSYPIVEWVGNYGVVIDTQAFGRVTIWVKDTDALFSDNPAPQTPPEPAPAPLPPLPPVPTLPPAAPLQAPNTETYEVIIEVTGYTTSNQAVNHASVTKTVQIPLGTYFIFNKRFLADGKTLIALNLTKTLGTPGAWINPDDNKDTPPAPEPAVTEATPPVAIAEEPVPDFASTYREFPQPQLYVAMKQLSVVDLASVHKTAAMPQYSTTYIVGTFVIDGVEYARPLSAVKSPSTGDSREWWYGIPWIDRDTNTANLELEREVFKTKTTLAERVATRTLRPTDHIQLVYENVKKILLGFIRFFGKISSDRQQNK